MRCKVCNSLIKNPTEAILLADEEDKEVSYTCSICIGSPNDFVVERDWAFKGTPRDSIGTTKSTPTYY